MERSTNDALSVREISLEEDAIENLYRDYESELQVGAAETRAGATRGTPKMLCVRAGNAVDGPREGRRLVRFSISKCEVAGAPSPATPATAIRRSTAGPSTAKGIACALFCHCHLLWKKTTGSVRRSRTRDQPQKQRRRNGNVAVLPRVFASLRVEAAKEEQRDAQLGAISIIKIRSRDRVDEKSFLFALHYPHMHLL